MKRFFGSQANDYRWTLQKGVAFVRSLSGDFTDYTGSREENISRLKNELKATDAIVIGAGAGLSTAAGFTYSGERFSKYFFDFQERFGIMDMYSGGFYPFPNEETRWAWWARHIYFNRYVDAPKPVYQDLLALVKNKDYFVITTNVDHQFQRAGFSKQRLFYTQGDYGLFQSADGKIKKTYDNEEWVMQAMTAQGFVKDEQGKFQIPQDGRISLSIPQELIPVCPDDGGSVAMNLRADDTFVEDVGWHAAADRYASYLNTHEGRKIIFFEIGVGANTPMIIKYPFWAMTAENSQALYVCLNFDEAICPKEIRGRSICINGDSSDVLSVIV